MKIYSLAEKLLVDGESGIRKSFWLWLTLYKTMKIQSDENSNLCWKFTIMMESYHNCDEYKSAWLKLMIVMKGS